MENPYTSHFSRRLNARRATVLLPLLFAALLSWAQHVGIDQARGIAADFFSSHGVHSAAALQSIKQLAPAKNGADTPYYIFNSADASAFVVVSADSRAPQVLAYSTEGSFAEADMAPGAAYMLEQYALYVGSLRDGAQAPASRASVDFGSGKLIATAVWDQNPSPWWDYCPVYNGQNTYAGCVATAMAILMRHYEWPARGFGSKTYTTPTLGLELSADFEALDYDWASLPKTSMSGSGWSSASKALIGKILYQCGVAANMDYNTGESSAYSSNQAVGLFRYFGYTLGNYVPKDGVSDDDWYAYILDEIDGDNPVLYRGQSDSGGGHAFICDGYDSAGNLHFNFGWSGSGNGYYAILSSNMTYRNSQGVTLGVRPVSDAATRTLPDFQLGMCYNGDPDGLTITGEGIIHRGQSFTAKVNKLLNAADRDVEFALALFVCDANGTPSLKLGEYSGLSLNVGSSYGWVTISGGLPYDYTVADTDYLGLYSSTDGGATWKQVTCYDPALQTIRLADVYDSTPSHLEMISVEGKGFGLTVRDGSMVNVKGQGFYVSANCLKNILSQSFTGDVAAFLCDNSGTPKYQIGSNPISGLSSRSYYSAWNIACNIPRGSDVQVGDKIMVFSKLSGEDAWASVVCSDPDKAYIEITAETLAATPPQLKMIDVADRATGLTLDDGAEITVGSGYFYVTCNCVQNIMPSAFDGDMAIFLCDSAGKPVYMLGSSPLSGLNSQYYRYIVDVKCSITADMDVVAGDRLGAFSRYSGDDAWVPVDCAVPEAAYLEIPAAVLPTEKAVSFSTPFATFCSRYDLDLSGVTGIYAYKALEKDGKSVVLSRVTEVKAGEGVLLRGMDESSQSFSASFAVVDGADTLDGNLFVGVLDGDKVIGQDAGDVTNYVLGSLRGVAGFYIADGVTVTRGHAYLAVPGMPDFAPASIAITFADEDVNGIADIEQEGSAQGDAYTVQGIKVANPDKGIYIINGRKIFKK